LLHIAPMKTDGFPVRRQCCTFECRSRFQTIEFTLHSSEPNLRIWMSKSFMIGIWGFLKIVSDGTLETLAIKGHEKAIMRKGIILKGCKVNWRLCSKDVISK